VVHFLQGIWQIGNAIIREFTVFSTSNEAWMHIKVRPDAKILEVGKLVGKCDA
jgi:hypothetical protein